MQACVASIFELPLEKVPNFMMGGSNHYAIHLKKWCDRLGVVALDISFQYNDDKKLIKDCYVVAVGKSPGTNDGVDDPEYKECYKNAQHAVVWLNGKMVHDPHPSGRGLAGDPDRFTVFIIKDPSKILNLEDIKL